MKGTTPVYKKNVYWETGRNQVGGLAKYINNNTIIHSMMPQWTTVRDFNWQICCFEPVRTKSNLIVTVDSPEAFPTSYSYNRDWARNYHGPATHFPLHLYHIWSGWSQWIYCVSIHCTVLTWTPCMIVRADRHFSGNFPLCVNLFGCDTPNW